jgi:hypothetical protein
MATVIETFKAVLGVDVEPGAKKTLKDLENSVDGLIKGFGAIVGAVSAATVGIVAYTTATNKTTAVQANLANSLGISAAALENYGFLLGEIGLDQSAVITSLRKLNDGMGELAQGAKAPETLKRALKNLNLEFKNLKDLAPQHQMSAILDASQKAENGQLAMAAAAEFLGRDSGKMIGWLRNQDEAITDLLIKQAQMNLQTEEGRRGAVRMTAAMDNLGAITESAGRLFSGIVGDAIAPIVEAFNDWVAVNNELIKTKIKDWAEGFGRLVNWLAPKVKSIVRVIGELWSKIDGFVKSTIGWKRVIRALAVVFGLIATALATASILKFVIVLQRLINSLKLLKLAALKPILLLAAIGLIAEDIYSFLEGKKSVTGGLLKLAEEWLGIELIKPIRTAWPAVKQFMSDAASLFANYLGSIVQSIAAFVDLNISTVSNLLRFVGSLVQSAVQILVSFFKVQIDTLVNLVKFVIDLFQSGFEVAWNNLMTRMGLTFHEFIEGFVGGFKDAFDDVVLFIDRMEMAFHTFIEGMIGNWTWAIDRIKSMLSGAKTAIFATLGIGDGGPAGVAPPIVSPAQAVSTATTNNSTTTNNKANVNANITIQQQPGESQTGLANRIKDVVKTMAADAMVSNSSGVEY